MTKEQKREAVIWGAGKIGRGFLAELFQDAGFQISFFDSAENLVRKLNTARSYSIHKVMGKGRESRVVIQGFEAYHTSDLQVFINKLKEENTIIAVAVHPAALRETAEMMIPGLVSRAKAKPESTLDMILCVNMTNPARSMRSLLEELLPGEVRFYLDRIGLVESVVMRVSPEAPPELLERDGLTVVNNGYPEMPLDKKAFKGIIPQSKLIRLTENIEAEEIRKIYTLNMAHGMLAYLGSLKGYKTVAECMEDPDIKQAVRRALDEAALGLKAKFAFGDEEMEKWNHHILDSLDNPILGDRLDRLGADVRRKLSRHDRLVGPAMLCWELGVVPEHLALGIAGGFMFQQSQDPGTQAVQLFLQQNGIEKSVRYFCGLEEERFVALVVSNYKKLCQEYGVPQNQNLE